MLVYITIRFEAITGISAVLCLLHDLLVILTAYTLFRIPMSTTFIAAILTILGYSINATIIVFDRVRENMKLIRKTGFADIVNKSIWQTFARSVNTSLTTLFTVLILYFLGVPSIKAFALPIIIGIVAGTYSSVFMSGNIWVLLKQKLPAKR
ncbi:Protein translocase subunit SecF [bioreactor metagenome]|uniref:Protein translocase subunit SecF n=1 Tax=bioreactor metagenome TaxID=1076179 RepID=A0A645H928_9ZZZZ